MNPLAIIETYYAPNTALYELLVLHSRAVADKALFLANQHPELSIDCKFVEEAAMLHDIGIFLTNAPSLGCYGAHRYIEHGYLGADLLRQHGLDKHALVCERHTGTGLSLADIEIQQLPLPHRDMRPVSMEEQLICFADKFFSKSRLNTELAIEQIRDNLAKFGVENLRVFDHWMSLFL